VFWKVQRSVIIMCWLTVLSNINIRNGKPTGES
jgi:hypothetical protein